MFLALRFAAPDGRQFWGSDLTSVDFDARGGPNDTRKSRCLPLLPFPISAFWGPFVGGIHAYAPRRAPVKDESSPKQRAAAGDPLWINRFIKGENGGQVKTVVGRFG